MIWPGFVLVRDPIYVHLICKFQEALIKTEWIMLTIKSNRDSNSRINDPIWTVFELIRDFIHVRLICKFLIKTKQFMLVTKSNRGFFSNQEEVTLRLMILSGQFSNLSKISPMSTLSPSFRHIRSKLNELCWWQCYSLLFCGLFYEAICFKSCLVLVYFCVFQYF